MKLNGVIQNISELSPKQKERMFILMTAHYENVDPGKFLKDLAEKDGVLVLYDGGHQIQGFTTFLLMEFSLGNGPMYALYSGDTIVDKHFWGQQELFREFGRLFKMLIESRKEPLYWFLLTKGIRTYHLLPLFFKEFYPNFSIETPRYYRDLMMHLAILKFGNFYHKEQGIVRIVPKADRLQQELACIPEHKQRNPHVRFFVRKNPGYTNGDELVCIARISTSNLTRIAKRFANL